VDKRFFVPILGMVGLLGFAPSLAFAAGGVAQATVSDGGVSSALLLPSHPRGALALLAGGDGNIGVGADGAIAREGNQFVRTRAASTPRLTLDLERARTRSLASVVTRNSAL